jgi:hypothetical protein
VVAGSQRAWIIRESGAEGIVRYLCDSAAGCLQNHAAVQQAAEYALYRIEEVSRAVEMTRKESEVIVEAIYGSIVRSLRKADKIEIRGFGSFRTRQRQARASAAPAILKSGIEPVASR